MAARRGPSQSFKEKASAGQWQHCHRERTSDRPGLWRGRLVERVLFAQRIARLVGQVLQPPDSDVRAGAWGSDRGNATPRRTERRRSPQIELSAAVILCAL